jgi:hypothetical protein
MAGRVIEEAERQRGGLVPREVNLTVTRNYGEAAEEKS